VHFSISGLQTVTDLKKDSAANDNGVLGNFSGMIPACYQHKVNIHVKLIMGATQKKEKSCGYHKIILVKCTLSLEKLPQPC
jgi:hypothetical protein